MTSSLDLKPQRTWMAAVVAAVVVTLALLPDYDAFIQKMAGTRSLFTTLTGIAPDLVFQHGLKFLLVLSAAVALPVIFRSLRHPLMVLFAVMTVVITGYGVGRLLFADLGLKGALSGSNAAFVVVFFLAVGAAAGARWIDVRKGLVFALFAVAFAKLAFAVYAYRKFGGVELFSGVASLAADGGVLTVWSMAGLWSFLFAYDNLKRRRVPMALAWTVVFIVFVGALAASFRRDNMIRLVATIVLSMNIAGFLERRALRSALLSLAAAGVGAVLLFATMVAVFGQETAWDRVFSVSKSSESRFAGSNEAYSDDWRAWGRTFEKHDGLGVGVGQRYGVDRLVENTASGDGLIPLHTGTYELGASLGFAGILYQGVAFLLLPLMALARMRRSWAKPDVLFSASAASILWMGLWPFGPPFYYDPVVIVLLGLQFGVVGSLYRVPSSEPTESGFEPAGSFASFAPMAPNPAAGPGGAVRTAAVR